MARRRRSPRRPRFSRNILASNGRNAPRAAIAVMFGEHRQQTLPDPCLSSTSSQKRLMTVCWRAVHSIRSEYLYTFRQSQVCIEK